MSFRRGVHINDINDIGLEIKKHNIRPYEFPPIINSYLDIQLPSTLDIYDNNYF